MTHEIRHCFGNKKKDLRSGIFEQSFQEILSKMQPLISRCTATKIAVGWIRILSLLLITGSQSCWMSETFTSHESVLESRWPKDYWLYSQCLTLRLSAGEAMTMSWHEWLWRSYSASSKHVSFLLVSTGSGHQTIRYHTCMLQDV